MKKILLLICLVIVFSLSVTAQPGIKFNNNRHDFGNVAEGSYPTWIFIFHNSGNQDLKLIDVKASCGCTSPQWSKDPIKPGDSGEVKVVFNTNGYAGRPFSKSVTVTTNISENNEQKQEFLFIQGNVMAKVIEPPQYAIKFSESKHDLGSLKPGKKIVWPITIVNDGDSTITIKNIVSTCSCISFKDEVITIAPHKFVAINATLKTKGITPKTLNETIKVVTNLAVNTTKVISEKGYLVTVIIADTKKK